LAVIGSKVVNVDVSLSVVTFNNSGIIKKLLNNIIDVFSNKVLFRVYVIDNGSTDGTVNICKKISMVNPEVQIIESVQNKGFGSGHNSILPLLDSKYHIILNPDISIESFTEIQKILDFMNLHEEVGLLSPLILNEDGSIQRLYKLQPTVLDLAIRFISPNFLKKRQKKFVRLDTGYDKIGPIDYASGCFMFFRTNILKKISGFDEKYFMYMEDADITRKVNDISRAVFFPCAKVTHTWMRESHKKIKYVLITLKSMWIYFNKWGWKFY
jgi:GT2 family glycosyltransferase